MLRYIKILICTIGIVLVTSNTIVIAGYSLEDIKKIRDQYAEEDIKIKDLFGFSDNLAIVIEGVFYDKDGRLDSEEEIAINTEEIKNMFLNKAVLVSGIDINHNFDWEKVSVHGVLKDNQKTYRFSYNLGGSGWIKFNDKDLIQFGDRSLQVPSSVKEE